MFPLFHNIFNIFLSKGVKLHAHLLNLVVRLVFSSVLRIWYVEVRISRSDSEGPFDYEISRVDCMFVYIEAYFEHQCSIYQELTIVTKTFRGSNTDALFTTAVSNLSP